MHLSVEELLHYTGEERRRWEQWFQENGEDLLRMPIAGSPRAATVGGLIIDIFSSELRCIQELRDEPLSEYHGRPCGHIEEVFGFGLETRRAMRNFVRAAGDEDCPTARSAQGPVGGPPTGGGTPISPPPGRVVREFIKSAQGPVGGSPTGGGTPISPPPGRVVREFLRSAQAASPRRHTDPELTPAARGSRSVVREFPKSAQAASPQRHTDQELTQTARGSRSVVREFIKGAVLHALLHEVRHWAHVERIMIDRGIEPPRDHDRLASSAPR